YVADLVKVLVRPGGAEILRIGNELVAAGGAVLQGFESRLGGQHACLHRIVAALDARQVHEAGRAADQRAAGEGQLRNRLQAALVDGTGAVGNALAALEEGPDVGMRLEALEFVE